MEKIVAPLPGKIDSISVKPGQAVEADELILTLEAMKMKNEIFCDAAGTVKEVLVSVGAAVTDNQLLVVIE